ncbi:tRNA lysidine(34) synthetase TilS [Adhaeretor mobilis]|uniref:tRNA(Ile)-lysidine synthase n=1 Tax=Adhaeretor mobilis TaxID=1930276 RepID=A0A517N047_9BACT|nr:tRNA lysidine(34) synthetase TilS [Adhaeretor mobilis]QDT00512.1 tRNA(Ile)-lysidine synthase [Adhaeretor mobilis]
MPNPPREPAETLPERLAASWPTKIWRDVHVLVAVSGGVDSMALLRLLLGLKHQAGGRGQLTAAHVNHQLRGEQSEADARWLAQQCQELEIPLEVLRADVTGLAKLQGDGLERAARDERYRLLTEAAERIGARYVAVGHHRDDQVETVLFRLLRGTGLLGLAGMQQQRALSTSVTLVRPQLEFSREELHGYLGKLGQDHREDASNTNSHFARNRLRNELLPLLREDFNAKVDQALLRTAQQAGEAYTAIHSQAEQVLTQSQTGQYQTDGACESGGFALLTGLLSTVETAVAIETLRIAWRNAGLPEQGMSDAWWRKLVQLAVRGEHSGQPKLPAQVNLPGNLLARYEGGRLSVWSVC